MSVSLSVHPHGITWLPVNRFSWKFMLGIFNQKIYACSKGTKISGTLHRDLYVFIISR
jgi:hypothetical protein